MKKALLALLTFVLCMIPAIGGQIVFAGGSGTSETQDFQLFRGASETGKPALTWTKVEGATSYAVYRALDGYSPTNPSAWNTYPIATLGSETTTFTDTNAPEEHSYYYRIVAYVSGGHIESNYIQNYSKLATPSIYKIGQILTTGAPRITWKPVENALRFTVYRKLNDEDAEWSLVATVSSDTVTYEDDAAICGKTYCYQVQAMSGKSTYYDSVYSKTQTARCILPKPTGVKVEMDAAGIPTVSWDPVKWAYGYRLKYKATDATEWKELFVTATTVAADDSGRGKLTLTEITFGKTYEYQLQAVWSLSSSISYNSGWVSGNVECNGALKIAKQPANARVTVGDVAKFQVELKETGTFTYQWQSRKNASSAWTNSGQSGAKTATLKVATTAGLHGWQFRCIVTDKNGRKATSDAATLKLVPKITTQPKNTRAQVGNVATFTVAAQGKATLKYQWQSRKNASSAWSNSGQPGAKTATLKVTATAGLNGWQFRCVVTDGNGQSWGSGVATLTVVPKFTTQPKSVSAASGSTVKFTAAAIGQAPLSYQWQSRKDASSAWSNSGQPGAKTATLSVTATAGLSGWQFRCVVTDANGKSWGSAVATLTVK